MEEEPPVEIEYQEEEEDDQTKLLRVRFSCSFLSRSLLAHS